MTQQEYENKKRECWEEYKRENLDGEVQWQLVSRYDVFCAAFDRAYALGKQEQETDTVIQGWVAVDRDDLPRLHYTKPNRTDGGYWQGSFKSTYFPKGLFPDLTWDDDPIEVELIIKRKKK